MKYNIRNTNIFGYAKKKSLLHNAINLVISQKISFEQGRIIRQNLYKKIGAYEITLDLVKRLNKDDFKTIGLDENKIT